VNAVTCALFLSLVVTWSVNANATSRSTQETFAEATAALKHGAYSEAIEQLEQLSDRGVVTAAASHNRALAYLLRAESPKRKPGDLGQASAALREAAALDSEDHAAQATLAAVSREISRQRAQRGQDPVVVELPLANAVVALLPENFWAAATLFGSLTLAIGFFLRRQPLHTPLRLAGQIAVPTGVCLLLVFGGLTALAHHSARSLREAVVIVPEAPLLDATGKLHSTKALGADATAIPEGASVLVKAQQGQLAQVLWGSADAWVQSSNLRLLAIAP
jgi:hypothetical protein